MKPLSTGYAADRQHATESAHRGWTGRNTYDQELEEKRIRRELTESTLQSMLREQEQARRQKQRDESKRKAQGGDQ